MKESAVKRISIAILLVTLLTAIALYMGAQGKFGTLLTSSRPENTPESFFDGAVIKFIVPNNPGGGYDEYARLIAPYIEKYTGSRVQLKNIPGSGGTRALNELFKSPADGLTIGLVNGSGMVTNQIAGTGDSSLRIYDLSFLGRVVDDIRVLTISTQNEFRSFADIMNVQLPVNIGATGFGGSTYVDAVVSRQLFDLNVNVIHGFNNSSTMRHAMLRGDLDGAWSSLGSVRDEVDSGQIRIVLQAGDTRSPALPEVPAAIEFKDKTANPLLIQNGVKAWGALQSVGRLVAAPPGIAPERLWFLREAFRQALYDPQFLAETAQSRRPVNFASGEDMENMVRDA